MILNKTWCMSFLPKELAFISIYISLNLAYDFWKSWRNTLKPQLRFVNHLVFLCVYNILLGKLTWIKSWRGWGTLQPWLKPLVHMWTRNGYIEHGYGTSVIFSYWRWSLSIYDSNKNECHIVTILIIYWKEIKWVRVWNSKMGGVHVSNLKYINMLLFYSMEILDTKSLGFRCTHNNTIYIAIANKIVNYSSIQVFYNVCFTNYNFEILVISLFIFICNLC